MLGGTPAQPGRGRRRCQLPGSRSLRGASSSPAAPLRLRTEPLAHRLPDGVRTNGFFYRSAINSHDDAIIMP